MKEDYLKEEVGPPGAERNRSCQQTGDTKPDHAVDSGDHHGTRRKCPPLPAVRTCTLNMAIGDAEWACSSGDQSGVLHRVLWIPASRRWTTWSRCSAYRCSPSSPRTSSSCTSSPTDVPDAEAYRILRTNIEFNRKSADANTISMVSGGPGEGKSTTLCQPRVHLRPGRLFRADRGRRLAPALLSTRFLS